MASRKKRFDAGSRQIFFDIQNNILTLKGQLMNPKRSEMTRDLMIARITTLRAESKRMKVEFYEQSHLDILASTSALVDKVKTYEGKSLRKI
jgi:hypothetical protein